MPVCGSGAFASSSALLIRGHLRRCQAETPLIPLSRFSGPALSLQIDSPDFAGRMFPSIDELDTAARRDYRVASFEIAHPAPLNRVVRTPSRGSRYNSAGLTFAALDLSVRTSVSHSAFYTWKLAMAGKASSVQLGLNLVDCSLEVVEFDTDRAGHYPVVAVPGWVSLRKAGDRTHCSVELQVTRSSLDRMAVLLASISKGDNVTVDIGFSYDPMLAVSDEAATFDVTGFSLNLVRSLR
jgi:hypothetical protein